jgi:hypothetical protein
LKKQLPRQLLAAMKAMGTMYDVSGFMTPEEKEAEHSAMVRAARALVKFYEESASAQRIGSEETVGVAGGLDPVLVHRSVIGNTAAMVATALKKTARLPGMEAYGNMNEEGRLPLVVVGQLAASEPLFQALVQEVQKRARPAVWAKFELVREADLRAQAGNRKEAVDDAFNDTDNVLLHTLVGLELGALAHQLRGGSDAGSSDDSGSSSDSDDAPRCAHQ